MLASTTQIGKDQVEYMTECAPYRCVAVDQALSLSSGTGDDTRAVYCVITVILKPWTIPSRKYLIYSNKYNLELVVPKRIVIFTFTIMIINKTTLS